MLAGDKVFLTALDRANAETSRAWINDPEINRWLLSGLIPLSATSELAWYDSVERRGAEKTAFVFEIHDKATGRYIGNCGLESVDMVHRHAEVGILIGVVAEQNKGFGRDAIRTLLRFGFDTLGLHEIEIRYIVGNERAGHLYRSVGFTETGVLRQHLFVRGAFVDEVVLDMLASEWAELR